MADEPKINVPRLAAAQLERPKPASEMSSKELKDALVNEADKKLHPSGEPEKQADKTSYPVPNDAEINDPPLRTNRPDVPIITSLGTGAGAHVPPSPDEVHPDGRPVYDEEAASEGKEGK
jgi:hypothetical protein